MGYSREAVFLAADIGGTKTSLGYFVQVEDLPRLEQVEVYSSREYARFEDILSHFVKAHQIQVKAACIGIAGPVIEGRCGTTNLPWEVSEADIYKGFGISDVKLINDLVATGFAIPFLKSDDKVMLTPQPAFEKQTIGLIAPGTGLGQCLLGWAKDRYVPIPSEGGHADFAPTCDEEIALWRYLREIFGHVSIERVLSGQGLVNIFSWLKAEKGYEEPDWLKELVKKTDPAGAIAEAGLAGRDPLCIRALDRFVSILGSVAGNLALTGLALGGIYLGGGIPPKVLPKLKEDTFLRAFLNKGRFKGLVERIPVTVICNERAALLGAARFAADLIP